MTTPLVKPSTILEPFAIIGAKNAIPQAPNATPGAASLDLGFPPLTMTSIQTGGVPPSGLDFNGILNLITQHSAWLNGGGQYTFDAALSTFVGGYKIGAVVQSDDGLSAYVSLAANNTTNFNSTPSSIGTLWAPWAGAATLFTTSTVTTTGGSTTLTAVQYGPNTIIVNGTLASNATLVFPNIIRTWRVINNTTGAFTLSLKAASGATLGATQGKTNTVMYDGTQLVFPDYDSGLVSPAFSGTPTAPTAAPLTNTTQLATTAFVTAAGAALTLNTSPRYVNGAITASSVGDLWTDTRVAAFTITLPDPPVAQNILVFRDVGGSWGTNNLTVDPGTKTILGSAGTLTCDITGEEFGMWYDTSGTPTWRLI